MTPSPVKVRSDSEMPRRVDVVVVGGGIVGVSTAYYLAKRGVSVAIFEKGEIAAEQSSRNWGWVRKQGGDPDELPLTLESVRLWNEINVETGGKAGFTSCGSISLASNEQDIAACEAWLKSAQDYLPELGTKVLAKDELNQLLPGGTNNFVGGLYTATDGRAEPLAATSAIAEAARQHGALLFTRCAVRGFETEAGRISAVVTERGAIACGSVVLAGGIWSRMFCENMGIFLPLLKLRTSVMSTEPLNGGPDTAAMAPGYSFRKRRDGGYTLGTGFMNYVDLVPDSFRLFSEFWPTLRHEYHTFRLRFGRRFFDEWRQPSRWSMDAASPFERHRIMDPEPVVQDLEDVLKTLRKDYPVFDNAKVAARWAGIIDASPDARPFLTPIASQPGFFVATGFSGHGFGNGPGAGRLMADLVMGSTPIIDPRPFRYSRFTDGPRPEYRPRI